VEQGRGKEKEKGKAIRLLASIPRVKLLASDQIGHGGACSVCPGVQKRRMYGGRKKRKEKKKKIPSASLLQRM
jgi:hypothetical protein